MEDAVVHLDNFNSASPLLPRSSAARAIWAVYDGHGGSEVSTLAAEVVHRELVYFLTRELKRPKLRAKESDSSDTEHTIRYTEKNTLRCLYNAVKKADKYICEKSVQEGMSFLELIANSFQDSNRVLLWCSCICATRACT